MTGLTPSQIPCCNLVPVGVVMSLSRVTPKYKRHAFKVKNDLSFLQESLAASIRKMSFSRWGDTSYVSLSSRVDEIEARKFRIAGRSFIGER